MKRFRLGEDRGSKPEPNRDFAHHAGGCGTAVAGPPGSTPEDTFRLTSARDQSSSVQHSKAHVENSTYLQN